MLSVLAVISEPSKVPFYICGGLLVLWAVAVSAVGLVRETFPFGLIGQRAIMAVSLILAAAAVVTAIATSK